MIRPRCASLCCHHNIRSTKIVVGQKIFLLVITAKRASRWSMSMDFATALVVIVSRVVSVLVLEMSLPICAVVQSQYVNKHASPSS